MHRRVAVLLCNFGGPNKIDEVESVLFNLFNDQSIISIPQPFRWLLAKLISKRRAQNTTKLYKLIGGKSPILENTLAQGSALQQSLLCNTNGTEHFQYQVFIAMRYNHPNILEIIPQINDYYPTDIILLPLYPQYSITTTGSSFKEFYRYKNHLNSTVKIHQINYYHHNHNFICACVDLIEEAIRLIYKTYSRDNFSILFSAHSLPQKIINAGDLYQKHIEESVTLIIAELARRNLSIDYIICYQSKVGRLKWLEPSTESVIINLAQQQKGIVVFPVAFTSEHIETLVELDIEYRELAEQNGALFYNRVQTVSTHQKFIECLREQVIRIMTEG